MYLKNLSLSNFRSFGKSEIPLCKDLTILVGENNGGKSNAIDAIRLLTAPLGGRRELYCETTDIRFGSDERKFELTATFTELTPAQQGRMISAATDAAISGCVFGLKYDETTGRFPVRPVLWGGHQNGNPEPGCHDMVRHVYLPPLRDSKRGWHRAIRRGSTRCSITSSKEKSRTRWPRRFGAAWNRRFLVGSVAPSKSD